MFVNLQCVPCVKIPPVVTDDAGGPERC